MPWLRRAVQERGPWKGWGHSQSHWDAALDRPPVRVGFTLQDTSLGEGIHQYKLAPSHPTPHPSHSWAAGWEQGELTWAPVSALGITGGAGAGRSQAGARWHSACGHVLGFYSQAAAGRCSGPCRKRLVVRWELFAL